MILDPHGLSLLLMLTGLIGLIFQDRVTLAAGASVANEFAGQEIEIEDRDVYLELAVVSDAAPTTTSPSGWRASPPAP